MRHRLRFWCLAAILLSASFASAEQSYVTMTAFPNISVADGHSTITITTEVRDSAGKFVADGTQVQFDTDLGSFRESIVTTSHGIARATLVAGGIPGIAKIRAKLITGEAPPQVLQYEFVKTREELSSAREYAEITSSDAIEYSSDQRILNASGANHGAVLRFRDIEIEADELQYDILAYRVIARNAKMKVGSVTRTYGDLYFSLNEKTGVGTTAIQKLEAYDTLSIVGGGVVALRAQPDGTTYALPGMIDAYGLVNIQRADVTLATGPVNPKQFDTQDLSSAISSIYAKKAIVFPRKEIQFQRADLYVNGARLVKMPLFVANLYGGNQGLITDNILAITDNQVALNYPHYLILRPGLTSVLRFRTGDSLNRGYTSSSGAFLDYELSWNRGDDFTGGLTVGGVGREDWLFSLNQYWKMDERSTAYAVVNVPAASSVNASGNISHQFNGFSANLSADQSMTFRGFHQQSQNYGLSLEKDPTKLTKKFKIFYGVTTSTNTTSGEGIDTLTRNSTGFTTRIVSDAIPLAHDMTLTTTFGASKLYGENSYPGIGLTATTTIARRVSKAANVFFTHNYVLDGFSDTQLGRNRISATANYSAGNINTSFTANKSLGLDRVSYWGDLSYKLSNQWGLSYSYTFDQAFSNTYLDYTVILGYKIGWKMVGLTWSQRTSRIGFELMGARF